MGSWFVVVLAVGRSGAWEDEDSIPHRGKGRRVKLIRRQAGKRDDVVE